VHIIENLLYNPIIREHFHSAKLIGTLFDLLARGVDFGVELMTTILSCIRLLTFEGSYHQLSLTHTCNSHTSFDDYRS